MKKVFYISMIVMIFITLQGCGNTQLSAKEVRIELGSEASEEIGDYVSVEGKYRDEFEQNAHLDLSGIDVHNVGKYQAIIVYEGKEVVVPIIVEDTTPPEIWLKDTRFREGDEVEWSEMVYVRDRSDVEMRVKTEGNYRECFLIYPGMELEVEATDAYGNQSVKKLTPYVREKEEKGIAGGSRIISPVYAEEMYYADEEAYQALKEAYGQVEWKSEFETGDLKIYGAYREKFRELIENEKPFYNKTTGEWMYLSEYEEKDLTSCGYFFFDMDSDGTPELGITNYEQYSFFKYDEENERFLLWKNEVPDYYQINGSRTISYEDYMHTDRMNFYFCKLDKNGEEVCTVWFKIWLYLDKEIEDLREVYIMTFPEYADGENEIPENIKKQGYNYYGTYIFRVTEEQYIELTRRYFESNQIANDNIMNVFYRYEELWGSSVE